MQLFTKLSTITLLSHLLSSGRVTSFPFAPRSIRPRSIAAFTSTIPADTITNAKNNVLEVANEVYEASKTGLFITNPSAIKKLKKVVAELEAVSAPPDEAARKSMIGDWKLVCTTNFLSSGREFPLGDMDLNLPEPPEFISKTQDKIRESVEVDQRIRSFDWTTTEKENEAYVTGSGKMTSKFNRVDNIIEFTPFELDNLANITLNLNPLEVSKSKVVLAHKAEVQSITPVLRTKLALNSVILNVAGKSQYLEPSGADVLALAVPLGDLLNSGYFDTTYVDDDIRISRGKVGLLNQLRVFVRKPTEVEVVADEEVENKADDAMDEAPRDIVAEIEEKLTDIEDEDQNE